MCVVFADTFFKIHTVLRLLWRGRIPYFQVKVSGEVSLEYPCADKLLWGTVKVGINVGEFSADELKGEFATNCDGSAMSLSASADQMRVGESYYIQNTTVTLNFTVRRCMLPSG